MLQAGTAKVTISLDDLVSKDWPSIIAKIQQVYQMQRQQIVALKNLRQQSDNFLESLGRWLKPMARVGAEILAIKYAIQIVVGMLAAPFIVIGKSIEEYNLSVINLATRIASLMEGTDIAANFAQAKEYSADLINQFDKMSAQLLPTTQEAITMADQLARVGIIVRHEDLPAFRDLANAVYAVAVAYPNKEVQIRQELRGLLTGQLKDTNELARFINTLTGNQLPKLLKQWEQQRTTVQELAKYLKAYAEATKDYEYTMTSVGSTIKSFFGLLWRDVFKDAYDQFVKFMVSVSQWLMEHSKTMSLVVKSLSWGPFAGYGYVYEYSKYQEQEKKRLKFLELQTGVLQKTHLERVTEMRKAVEQGKTTWEELRPEPYKKPITLKKQPAEEDLTAQNEAIRAALEVEKQRAALVKERLQHEARYTQELDKQGIYRAYIGKEREFKLEEDIVRAEIKSARNLASIAKDSVDIVRFKGQEAVAQAKLIALQNIHKLQLGAMKIDYQEMEETKKEAFKEEDMQLWIAWYNEQLQIGQEAVDLERNLGSQRLQTAQSLLDIETQYRNLDPIETMKQQFAITRQQLELDLQLLKNNLRLADTEEKQRNINDDMIIQKQKIIDAQRIQNYELEQMLRLEQPLEAFKNRWAELGEEANDAAKQAVRAAETVAQGMTDALSTGFFDLTQNKLRSLKTYIMMFLNDISRLVSQRLGEAAVFKGIPWVLRAIGTIGGGGVEAPAGLGLGEGIMAAKSVLTRPVTIVQNITTSDANSFRRSGKQIIDDARRMMERS